MEKVAYFRFYGELNDFLTQDVKQKAIPWHFHGTPSVKDAIEALGVPHPEVYLILINGEQAFFTDHIYPDDYVSVYPVFHSLNPETDYAVYPHVPEEIKFILDAHLGKLARYLRMLGFDSLYDNAYKDVEILRLAEDESRIVLTRDLGILKFRLLKYGYFVRNQDPISQLIEVAWQFNLFPFFTPFQRCMSCNGKIIKVAKEEIAPYLEPATRQNYQEFFQCQKCKQIYWKGSHYEKMESLIQHLKAPFN